MSAVWGRFLCLLGRHYWYGVQFVWGGYNYCDRCGLCIDLPGATK